MRAPEVEAALAQLEDLARRGVRPGHHVARRVLLALGAALREGPGVPAEMLERARAAGEAAGPAWREAVQAELTLACGEFAQCLDPRYVALPAYDIGYTRAARQRLADRLRAGAELGFGLEPNETRMLELADQVLAALERDRKAAGAAEERTGKPSAPGPASAPRVSNKGRRKS